MLKEDNKAIIDHLTLSCMFASMRKSKMPAVIFLLLVDGWHFHLHSSLIPSFSNVHDNCNTSQQVKERKCTYFHLFMLNTTPIGKIKMLIKFRSLSSKKYKGF